MTARKLRETIGSAIRSFKKTLCIFIDTAAWEHLSIEEAAAEAAEAAEMEEEDQP